MAGPQYVYVMKGLSKTYPGGRQVLKDIWLSFYPGAKIGIVGVNGCRQVHPDASSWRARTRSSPAKPGPQRASAPATCRRSRS